MKTRTSTPGIVSRLLTPALAVSLSVGGMASAQPLEAQVNARMLRYPDVSATHIAFVYAGDIWIVPKAGGTAQKLSSPKGEESFPRFSPDGSRIAFSGNYDGNTDVYVMPTFGGDPVRLTHHPHSDRMLDWYPDGGSVLYASAMESGRQRYRQFYKTSAEGGMPEKLPVPYGEFGMIAPDGRTLAYMPRSRDFRTWKRYRGGWNPDIWTFDLETYESNNLTNDPANDAQPMWAGETLYYLSDAGPAMRNNIWAYDGSSGQKRQVTEFTDFDVHFPSIGPEEIVFEAGGKLYLMDLDNQGYREVNVEVVSDLASLKPRAEKVADYVQAAWISPTGKRAVVEARGEIFTVPAEHGPVLNLTRSSGVAERSPTWSPDGKWIAYWSDRSGEYELTIRPADGLGEERTLTRLGAGYRYHPYWSPDSKKLAFVDETETYRIHDIDAGTTTTIDKGSTRSHGALDHLDFSWSPDSRWLAYNRAVENRNQAIFIYDTRTGQLHQATSGYYSDWHPSFGPEGKYLYFATMRSFEPMYGDFDNTWTYPNSQYIVAAALRPDVPSPIPPRNDEEKPKDDEENGENGGENDENGDDNGENEDDNGEKEDENGKPEPVEIEIAGLESRIVILPPEAGNYENPTGVKGKVVYHRQARTGEGEDAKSPVVFYDFKEREEKTVVEDADGYVLSADGKKLLVWKDETAAIVDLKADQKMEKPLRLAEMEMLVDPKAEWGLLFADAWRFQRDFFYDPNMHGVDWDAMREQYGALLEDAVTRWDVNYVIGELIGELSASHSYRGGGDTDEADRRGVGLLGVNWALVDNTGVEVVGRGVPMGQGAYRIQEIIRGAAWDADPRSPLDQPGVDVSEGDYVLAVNGSPLDTDKDPWASFQGLAGKNVLLTVNDQPTMTGARQVLVATLSSETRLRHLQWIERARQHVTDETEGRVGYLYVRSTGRDGQSELFRQYRAQWNKDALIIDERWNSGGQIPDRFVELLNRETLSYWAVRDRERFQSPGLAHNGPKVMLINGWSGSGGDLFPLYFKTVGLGPLVGMRTWGGLIGISGSPPLVDGGFHTVPTFRMYHPDGTWFDEGYGVEPDILVPEDPSQLARGIDPQLEAAIGESLRLLEVTPPPVVRQPPYEDRTAAGERAARASRNE
ncbi:MAG: S41 family peptidase [Gemmatimonadota bacterium]